MSCSTVTAVTCDVNVVLVLDMHMVRAESKLTLYEMGRPIGFGAFGCAWAKAKVEKILCVSHQSDDLQI
jgi:hypothetical protein